MYEKKRILRAEGQVKFYISERDSDVIPSKSMGVFYNKRMEINRDITNLAIKVFKDLYKQEHLTIVDLMAASGISSIRMLKECCNIKKIYINDINPIAVEFIKENLLLNNIDIKSSQIEVSQKDACLNLSEIAQKNRSNSNENQLPPNVISIDPFGTPNLYLDSAFKAIQKIDGLLCITATDTAVLFGVRTKPCVRKYMSKPLHNEYCKEIGARILVYFISRIANVNKMGIIPLLTFYTGHFIRVFCITFKDKKKIASFFPSYGFIIHCNMCGHRFSINNNVLKIPNRCPLCDSDEKLDFAGPLWINELHSETFIKEIIAVNKENGYRNEKRIDKLLKFILEENSLPLSYFNIHKLAQKLKLFSLPKIDAIIQAIKEKGNKASRTHFDFLSIKTDMNINSIKNIIIKLEN